MKEIMALIVFGILLFGAATGYLPGAEVLPPQVVQNPVAIKKDWENQKQDKITFSTRAPRANDNGGLWIQYTENSDTTIYIHVRHPITGTWRKATAS